MSAKVRLDRSTDGSEELLLCRLDILDDAVPREVRGSDTAAARLSPTDTATLPLLAAAELLPSGSIAVLSCGGDAGTIASHVKLSAIRVDTLHLFVQ